MYIWPSIKVRDSFKVAYLNNLERNLQRMKKSENQTKNKNPQSQFLINKHINGGEDEGQLEPQNPDCSWARVICRDVLWILTCCFCLGVCGDDEDL